MSTVANLKTGFWISIYNFIISLVVGVAVYLGLVAIGWVTNNPTALVIIIIVVYIILIPIQWIILGWSARRVLHVR